VSSISRLKFGRLNANGGAGSFGVQTQPHEELERGIRKQCQGKLDLAAGGKLAGWLLQSKPGRRRHTHFVLLTRLAAAFLAHIANPGLAPIFETKG